MQRVGGADIKSNNQLHLRDETSEGEKEMKKAIALVLALALLMGLAACAGTANEGEVPTPDVAATPAPVEGNEPQGKTALKAGTYTASKQGMNGDVTVEVVVTEDAISSVVVTENLETPGIGSPLTDASGNVLAEAGEIPVLAIPEKIVANQSVKVDAVTGATITSYAIINAVTDCLTQAGANIDEWKTEAAAAPAAPVNDQADVIVVGGGGAGLAAAVAAAQKGASVIIVEKNGAVGGDTLVCGAIYNCPDEDLQSQVTMTDAVKNTIEAALSEAPVSDEHAALQAEVKAQWDAYKAAGRTDLFDSKEWFALQTWINGDKVADLDLVKKLCYDSAAGYEWIKQLGMGFDAHISQGAGSLWQRTHTSTMQMGTGFISTYVENIRDNDRIKLFTNTTAKSLVMNNGRVSGVVCVDKNGNEVTYAANKGVVLATGGFSANSKMVSQYNTSGKWSDLSKVPTTNRFSCSQGDGINMALEVGASLTDMDQIQLLYLGNVKDGGLTKYPPRVVNGTDQEIFVNKNGERFVREDGRRDQICLAVLQQPDQMFYFIESGDGDYVDIAKAISADGFTFQYLEENGYIVIGDTVEELATKLGMDPATLQNTIDEYNACVEAGKDEKFGRTLFSVKLEKGPFVATPRQACVHHTMGGVTVDDACHVLDTNGNPIPGLVAAGEITGGIHGGNRLGGNAVVDTVVYGRQAGETIAAE